MRWPWNRRPTVSMSNVVVSHGASFVPEPTIRDVLERRDALKARAVRGVLTVAPAEYAKLVMTCPPPFYVTYAKMPTSQGVKLECEGSAGARLRAMRRAPRYWVKP